ncbi:glutaminase A [Arthrobacter crystallopoietes]|uniref:Glutaminase n=1 Tax=Crystallibacter crystallopoietes TaxID=37928 RepID=A0A1H1AC74_9MICC|nr:glutaminase A [Arthrobacter crystallopoietes]AUI51584.1 glutaminase A [Arthrobacter crystallopoietes]SDQ37325.1 L-glutaminase [Arthrobacter crystallopoietes]
MESPIQVYLQRIHDELSGLKDGTADSILSSLSGADPDSFGICLATADGHIYEAGDTRQEFTIQSISKPFTYGLALADLGLETVDEKIDVEPSGEAYNEISLAEGSGRPANAMINAGAITSASLVKGRGGQTRFQRIHKTFSAFAGRELDFDDRVFANELKHGHRNRALAHLLRSFDIIEGDPELALEDHFRACAVKVNCRDLALMATALANNGCNPISGEQVLDIHSVERVLSVMTTCGMYDDTGSWISTVGMPAKSGVSGGVLAVLPGQIGLAVFSPPLDGHGTSVRGTAAARRISQDMELHFVRAARTGRSAIHSSYDISAAPSAVRRNDEAAEFLRKHGHRARVTELNGDLLFAGTESMVRELTTLDKDVELVILDVRRVDEAAGVALRLLSEVRAGFAREGRELALIDTHGTLTRAFEEADRKVPSFATRTAAVEWTENQLISKYGDELSLPGKVAATDSPALSPLSDEDANAVQAWMEPKNYDDGDLIRRRNQPFGGIYFIVSGRVSTSVPGPDGRRMTLTTLSAGMTFGELALGSGNRQETSIRAEGPVELMLLSPGSLYDLQAEDPRLAAELWKALTRDAYVREDQYLRETAVRFRD